MGDTKHDLPDDVDFSGMPIGLRVMSPSGANNLYAGIQTFYGVDLGAAVGEGAKRVPARRGWCQRVRRT